MNLSSKESLLAASALACCILRPGASAQTFNFKPGLWEMTTSLVEQKGTFLDLMSTEERREFDKLPSDQRTKYSSLMAGPALKGTIPVKYCLTAEEAKAKSMIEPPEEGCKVVTSKLTPSSGDMVQRCSKDGRNTTTHISFSMPNSSTYEVISEMASEDGKYKMKGKMTGRWLGAACGDVKP